MVAMGSLAGMIVHIVSHIHRQQAVVQQMMVLVEGSAGTALGVSSMSTVLRVA